MNPDLDDPTQTPDSSATQVADQPEQDEFQQVLDELIAEDAAELTAEPEYDESSDVDTGCL